MPSNMRDQYFSTSKKTQRYAFATECLYRKDLESDQRILYTESSDGAATKMLLEQGFRESQLHPCNDNDPVKDPNATTKLKAMFPQAVVEAGDIHEVYKRGRWLGVWFDLEETWQKQRGWNYERVPKFDKATVVAVSLSSRGIKGGAETLAKGLDRLFSDKGGRRPSLSAAYEGKSGVMNMVYGLAIFQRPTMTPERLLMDIHLKDLHISVDEFAHLTKREWPDRHKYRVTDGCYKARVSELSGRQFRVHFLNVDGNYFLEGELFDFEKVKQWWETPPTPLPQDHCPVPPLPFPAKRKRKRTNVCPGCERKKGSGFPPKEQWYCGECW